MRLHDLIDVHLSPFNASYSIRSPVRLGGTGIELVSPIFYREEELSLDTLEHHPGEGATSAVIWLHGLGASGNDFLPMVPHLGLRSTRFIFPNAPEIPVTINGGMQMPAWYDILSMERTEARENADDIRATHVKIEELIEREVARGVPSENIVLAGFSQGAAMTLFTGMRTRYRLAGLMVLSGYLVVESSLDAERGEANAGTPILCMHGTEDEMVPCDLGRHAFERVEAGREAIWKTYAMGHEVNGPQIRDVRAWLRALL